ncbi:MAG: hypothetical protein QM478_06860 [Flavobacteriaceae bacterium]
MHLTFQKTITVVVIVGFFSISSFSQKDNQPFAKNKTTVELLDSLWQNPTSFFNINDPNWVALCTNLNHFSIDDLNFISDEIFIDDNAQIHNEATADQGTLGKMNKRSNKKKTKKFDTKMSKDFRNLDKYPNHKVVLIEGDSWMEYPLFLKDIADYLMKNDNLAIYSMASGGDWISNMISSGAYQEKYLSLKPDVFIISGGGNDILDEQNIKSFVNIDPIDKNDEFLNNYRKYVILRRNSKPIPMCNSSYCPIEYHDYEDEMQSLNKNVNQENLEHIINGRRYLNKNYYRWLVSLKLEYKMLITSLKKIDPEHFKKLMIITQGYDYAIPNDKHRLGVSLLLENGKWIKKPLDAIGITDKQIQQDIVMTLIFDFNEMLIELGKESSNIYHIDSREFTNYLEVKDNKQPGDYWFDELHPKSQVFKQIADGYQALIFNQFVEPHKVVNVVEYHKSKENY